MSLVRTQPGERATALIFEIGAVFLLPYLSCRSARISKMNENHLGNVCIVPPYDAPEIDASVWLAPGSVVVGNVTLGAERNVWYNAVIHGAAIENACLIDMNATALSRAVVGTGSLVAARALVPQGMMIPPHSLVAGIPGWVVRPLSEEDRDSVRLNSEVYLEYTEHHRSAHEKSASKNAL